MRHVAVKWRPGVPQAAQHTIQPRRSPVSVPSAPGTPLRAVVVVPPVRDFYFTRHRFSSLGARIVLRILRQYGLESTLLDFPSMSKNGKQIGIPSDIAYINQYMVPDEMGKLSYFTKYQIFGPSPEQCAQKICSLSPTLCFISGFAFSYGAELIDIAMNVKKLNSAITIVAGGAGVSAYPLYFLRDASVDFVLSGEAEKGLREFLKAFVNKELPFDKVSNLQWKQEGTFCASPVTGFADASAIEPVVSKVCETKNSVFVSTCLSRGCPGGCKFCSNRITHGTAFRLTSSEKILSKLEGFLIDEKGRNRSILINFEDDNMLLAPEYLIDIMRKARERFGALSFLAENGIDYRLLSPGFADHLISLGMIRFNFTLGSADESILENLKRKSSLAHFETIVRYIASKGIPVLSYFIAGLEGDSKDSIVDTLSFLSNLPTSVGVSLFYAVPNLAGFENMSLFDAIAPCVCNGSSAYPWNGTMSTCELVTTFRLSRYVNLLKSKMKSQQELELVRRIRSDNRLYTVVKNRKGTSIIEVPCYDRGMVKLFLEKAAAST